MEGPGSNASPVEQLRGLKDTVARHLDRMHFAEGLRAFNWRYVR